METDTPDPGMSAMIVDPTGTAGSYVKILCCECGIAIEPNPTNMCPACLRTHVDITADIPKQASIVFCKFCSRYLQPPASWVYASLESKELLTLCIKRLKGLQKVRLVDAGFIWTEPHSKRLKVKLSVQAEVLAGAIMQQTFVVEYVVTNQMCNDCQRVEAKDYWRAVVQVRQRSGHKKTMLFMEQLILKADMHKTTSFIKQEHGGIDFYYAKQQDARRMTDFLMASLPCQYKTAEELVTHDAKNNVFDYKHTFSVEIVPICKDHVVCLPKKLAQSLGNMGQLAVCWRVSQVIHLIDPLTCQTAEVPGAIYLRQPFHAVSGTGRVKELTEYTVIDIEPVRGKAATGAGQVSKKHQLADAWVVRSSELGVAAETSVRTHLGHLLNPGDTVLGFDLANANVNNDDLDKMMQTSRNVPDVILVKKCYPDRQKRQKKRRWQLKHLNQQLDLAQADEEYNEFLEDLEDDAANRKHINIYRRSQSDAATRSQSESTTAPDDEFPQIPLNEMLEDLHISDDEMEDAPDAGE